MDRTLLGILFLFPFAAPAHAYFGPGSGLAAILLAVALVLAVVMLIFGFVWYPLKRLARSRKSSQDNDS